MSDTLFDLNQYQSQAHISYSADWRDATGTDPAWEQPDRELDLGANPQGLVDDAPIGWRSEAEFTLTLQSGQTIEVTFVPCLVGKRRMHEFSFTGCVSPTGFKSHFVLAIESEKFPCPRDYAQAYAEEMVARFEAEQQRSGEKRSHTDKGARASQEVFGALDDSLIETAMPSEKTDALNYPEVEVVEHLSLEEAADRSRLELKVQRSFYEGGAALRELRDKRLYRSTHRTFEHYCQVLFSFSRVSAYNKITAAEVMDNLLSNALQNSERTNSQPPLPNSERQCKELAKLPKQQQPQAWIEAVARTPGKRIPAASTVKAVVLEMKGIVEPLNQKHPSPPELAPGDVVAIKALKRSLLHPLATNLKRDKKSGNQ